MTTTSQRFTWQDRDTAAQDLLQLVYFGPSSIATMALSLLGAIRSPSVVPQLIAIVEDDQRDVWQRSYALRSIVATSGDWFLPQLKAEMSMILQRRAAIMPNYQGHDLLDELHNLAAHHPKNREWFFSALDEATSLEVVCEFLSAAINLWQPDEFRGLLIDYLLKLLTAHPQPMDLAVIETLMLTDDAKVSAWLHQNTDKIAPDLMEISDPSSQTQVHLPDYLQSPAYRYLWDLYQHADGGDREAYHQLVQIARKWRGNIPLRAVATYLIGKLWPQYNVVSLLCDLLKYAEDSWGDDALPLTPIRFEAGEALKDRPSPQVWEEMIDAFFINPANILSDFMLDWIAHVTDQLDGLATVYAGLWLGIEDQRRWFKALTEINEEQLQQEVYSA